MIKTISIAVIMGMIWGSSFPISQIGVLHIGAFPFRFATILVSTLTMCILSFSYLKSSLYNLSKQEYLKLFLLCIPNIFLVPLINNIALGLTSVSSATFLIYMMPCITSIFSIFLTRKIHVLTLIAIALCAFGVILLSKTNHFQLGEYLWTGISKLSATEISIHTFSPVRTFDKSHPF